MTLHDRWILKQHEEPSHWIGTAIGYMFGAAFIALVGIIR
jgi:hypothetical protein